MNKIILTIVVAAMVAIAGPVFAGPQATVIGMSPVKSIATPFGRAVNSAVDGRWYQAADCEDAFRKFAATENAVAVYNSSVEFAARNKGLDCRIGNVKNMSVVFVGYDHPKICRKGGNTTAGFSTTENTLGMISLYSTPARQKLFRDAGANIKLIPYAGGKPITAALFSGEIDLAWMPAGKEHKFGDKVDCFAATNPTDPRYVGKQLDLPVADFRIQYVVFTNATDPAVVQGMVDNLTGAKFNKYLNKTETLAVPFDPSTIVGETTTYVDRVFKHWARKK